MNRVSQKVVEEQRFDNRSDLGSPTMLGLCSDLAGGAYYAYDENSIFEVNSRIPPRLVCALFLLSYNDTTLLKFSRGSQGF